MIKILRMINDNNDDHNECNIKMVIMININNDYNEYNIKMVTMININNDFNEYNIQMITMIKIIIMITMNTISK